MSAYRVSVSQIIDAPAETIYAILSDYHTGHPSILPRQYFEGLTVEKGGVGAGTVVRADMNVMGNRQRFRLVVSEPEPGRVLAEEDTAAGALTHFILEPQSDGQTRVTIRSDFRSAGGLRGFVERLVNPSITRRIYGEELRLLNEVARHG